MASGYCGNCGDPVSGNFCGGCGEVVEVVGPVEEAIEVVETPRNDLQMIGQYTLVSEDLGLNDDLQFLLPKGMFPDRRFIFGLLLMLFAPGIGQLIYTSEIMKDFNDYLWTRLHANSTLNLGSKKVEVRPTSFYVWIVSLPLLALVANLMLQYLNYISLLLVAGGSESRLVRLFTGGDSGESFVDINIAVYAIIVAQFVILPSIIALIVLLAPAFYIYHKHIILSQFIDLQYGSNTHYSWNPTINPSIFKVRQKSLIFLGAAGASIMSYVMAIVIFIFTLSLQATYIPVIIGVIFWLISIVIWLVYERTWHVTMYDLIKFEGSMKRNHSERQLL